MPVYDIAGLRVNIKNCKGRTLQQAVPYLADNQDESDRIDIVINVTEERVRQAMQEHPEMNGDDWEYMLTGSDFYTKLIAFDGILLHASCIAVDGAAYAFSADSGTGKSTHTKLWLKRFGDRALMINDDKPALREIDGTVYACGTPWSGKHDYSTPINVPLQAICFLERSEVNRIAPADPKKAVFSIFSQTIRRLGPQTMDKLLDVIDSLFRKVPIYEMGCNISDEAVTVAYNAMKPGTEA